MNTQEELKRNIHRNVSLCQIIEPLGNKKDCTTRLEDCSPRTKLEYFLVSGVNSSWAFYDLAGEIIQRGKQPPCIYKYAYQAQQDSVKNREGGKINFGQISLLLPLVTSQVLGYLDRREMSARDICNGVEGVLKNTTPEDVQYLERFIALARNQSYENHQRSNSQIPRKETPFDKIRKFREIIGEHPLVVGAGLTPDNAYEQLCISNGAIVGTSLKLEDNTYNPMDRQRVRDFMSVVKEARQYQENLASK